MTVDEIIDMLPDDLLSADAACIGAIFGGEDDDLEPMLWDVVRKVLDRLDGVTIKANEDEERRVPKSGSEEEVER